MSRLWTLLLSGPAPPDAVAVWFEDLPLDARLECRYGPSNHPRAMGLWGFPSSRPTRSYWSLLARRQPAHAWGFGAERSWTGRGACSWWARRPSPALAVVGSSP